MPYSIIISGQKIRRKDRLLHVSFIIIDDAVLLHHLKLFRDKREQEALLVMYLEMRILYHEIQFSLSKSPIILL